MKYIDYSVLMTVYYKENATSFKTAIDSIINQTKQTNDFVIVADGPLNEDLYAIINEYSNKYNFINVIKCKENLGSGSASKEGLKYIKNEIFAKMDSDDIAMPDRMEKELQKINEGYDVVGTAMSEFIDNPTNVIGIRMPPENHDDIVKFSKKRNPICNVTIMYKKSFIEKVGGFGNTVVIEDYTLNIKLIQAGARYYNIQEPLVNVRSNSDQMKRRGDKIVKKSLKDLRKYMLKTKYINFFEYCLYNAEALIFLSSPVWLKRIMYRLFLRKQFKG
jgi:glycosyltransferase involved in cell wall biosynthesis